MPAILIHSRYDIDLFCWFLVVFFGGGEIFNTEGPAKGRFLTDVYLTI